MLICKQIFHGFHDSLRGFWLIFMLDDDSVVRFPPQRNSSKISDNKDTISASNLTTLGLRRLENRTKHREQLTMKPDKKPKPLWVVFRCIFLNLICILALNFVLFPAMTFFVNQIIGLLATLSETGHNFVHHSPLYNYFSLLLYNVIHALWVMPLFCITRLVSAIWFQDIANVAFKRTDRPGAGLSFSRCAADFCYSILLETVFLLQAFLAGLLPIPALNFACRFLHLCLLYALYAFEYAWVSRQVVLETRLARVQNEWPYFLGFGFWLAFVTSYFGQTDVLIGSCLFGVCFPLLIVSGCAAERNEHERQWTMDVAVAQNVEVDAQDDKFAAPFELKIFVPSVLVSDALAEFVLKRAAAQKHIGSSASRKKRL